MRVNTVTFRGKMQVIRAYEYNGVIPWAIWNGKELMFSCKPVNQSTLEDGSAALQEIIELLQQGESRAQYSLKVYNIESGTDIVSNMPFSNSFGFVLYDDEDLSPYDNRRYKYVRDAEDKILALQAEIDELKEPAASGIMGSIGGFLNGIVEQPEIKQAIAIKIAGMIGNLFKMGNKTTPAMVAGIENTGAGTITLSQDQANKVQQALNVLATRDPELGDHLLKVADMILNNPGKYNMIVGML